MDCRTAPNSHGRASHMNDQGFARGAREVLPLSAREARGYSLRRAILAALNNDWRDAGFERECDVTLQQGLGLVPHGRGSFFMPTNLPFQVKDALPSPLLPRQRAEYQVGSGTGGQLVGTELL